MNGERGFVLVWGLLIVVLVGAASSILFIRSDTLLAESSTDRLRSQSFWAAEGGLEHARHALATDPEFTGAATQVGEVRAISKVTRTKDGWTVEVRATPGGAKIEAEVKPTEGMPVVGTWRSE